jgi:hypothetical protein
MIYVMPETPVTSNILRKWPIPYSLASIAGPSKIDSDSLLEIVKRGEFAINGFRNQDLRLLLFSTKGRYCEINGFR